MAQIDLKLGKLQPKKDERTLKLSNYIKFEDLPDLPVEFHYSQNIANWGMMGNNTIGDCTIAAAGHSIMSWTDDNNDLFIPPTHQIIEAYSAISGYNPSTLANDNGATCIDALNYWRRKGVAGHKIGAYMSFDDKWSKEIQYALYLFGVVYIGLQLPISAQNQPDRWFVGPNLQGVNEPGSWGGHCVAIVGYSPTGLDVITWGKRITMSWNFWYCYVDESYAIVSNDFLSNGIAPNGFKLQTLNNDLNNLK